MASTASALGKWSDNEPVEQRSDACRFALGVLAKPPAEQLDRDPDRYARCEAAREPGRRHVGEGVDQVVSSLE
jgi:hypothetical protein